MPKVRFAPSPTGFLHIGGARTALFNWMYAKSQGGEFVLRIEDTDLVRSKPEYEAEIVESMEWLGLKADEFYKQSERFDLYREHALRLLDEGKAYKEGEAVLLKVEKGREVKFGDLIRGLIVFNTDDIKDQVLLKSDGSPAYSFCCVLDDALMEISHVVRGEDHISNTPKQVLIYEALGFKPPKYAHLPLIMSQDGARLSKRYGAVAVTDYRKEGFLPEALVNYLMLLGWSPGGDVELMPLDKAIEKFSLKKINKTSAAFDMEKLKWVNGQYIKNGDAKRIANLLVPFLKEAELYDENVDMIWLEDIVKLYQSRMLTLKDFIERAGYFLVKDFHLSSEARQEIQASGMSDIFGVLADKLEALSEYSLETAEKSFRDLVSAKDIKPGDLVHPVRVALTGQKVGPGLFETMVVLGQEKTVARLRLMSC